MAIDISVRAVGFKEAQKALRGVKGGFVRAASEAINYGLRAGRTVAAKKVKERYNLKSGIIKATGLKINKAGKGKLEGSLEASGPMLPISFFTTSQVPKFKKFGKRSYQVVKAKIIRGGKAKIVKGAFMAKGRVFERRGPERDAPLGAVSTIGIPGMVKQIGIAKEVEEKIARQASERLTHLIGRELSKNGAKVK